MRVKSAEDVPPNPVQDPGAEGVRMRLLIGPDDGAANFHMRLFDIAPGGHTPRHSHPWEHEVYILSGRGVLREGGGEHELSPGVCAYVPAQAEHQFASVGKAPLKMLCVIPRP